MLEIKLSEIQFLPCPSYNLLIIFVERFVQSRLTDDNQIRLNSISLLCKVYFSDGEFLYHLLVELEKFDYTTLSASNQ